ncbi:MAG: patatin-like phospholipase family protein [Syntrophomonadaceae bacterium]|nr:patatin-like phospholipase family protein [Syntrophomonadaceae bacterium]MDD3023687.1 patatin-like phospholipase family protein [Syntrophomonadaceae bacterium]
MKSLGLALGGGGLKGLAHIGVLEIMQENNIPINMICGTSAGSIVAALYASGMPVHKMEKIAASLKPSDYIDYNILGIVKYLTGLCLPNYQAKLDGIIKGDSLEELVYQWTDGKSLNDVSMPLSIIAVDIDSGQEVVFTNQEFELEGRHVKIVRDALLSEAVRASISIPATFVPLNFEGMQMIDGGVRSIVPVTAAKAMGAQYILAVNLGQETYDTKVAGMIQIISRSLNILTYETSDTAEEIFADLIIFPRVGEVHLDDMDKAEQIIRAGRRAAKEHIAEIKNGLQTLSK